MTPKEKVQKVRQEIHAALIEREEETDLCLAGLLTQEHALLVGPPGTSKSLLAQMIAAALDGSRVFTCHFTKDLSREALFGPLDIPALTAGKYERVLAGAAADAEVIVFEEVFGAGPAVLDMTLMLLNERAYKEGVCQKKCPLEFALGVTNSWQPDGCEQTTSAFFDRFLLRKAVRPVATPSGKRRLHRLWNSPINPTSAVTTRLTRQDLFDARSDVLAMPVSDDAWHCLEEEILPALAAEGITAGDRRQGKAMKVAAAVAFMQGDARVEKEHLEILQHVLWDDPREQPLKCAQVVQKLANPVGSTLTALLAEANAATQNLDGDSAAAIKATKQLDDLLKRAEKVRSGNGRKDRVVSFIKSERKKILLKLTGAD